MGKESRIGWTDHTWNIARGCTKVNSDCKFCYMYREGDRFKFDPKVVQRTKSVFNLPLHIKEPSRIFASSLTDFFHEDCDAFRDEAWDIISRCPHHTFQLLTKRPERVNSCLPDGLIDDDGLIGPIPDHIWVGTSIGHPDRVKMVAALMNIPARIRFLSIEPLHHFIDMDALVDNAIENHLNKVGCQEQMLNPLIKLLKPFNWVVVGGESGHDRGKHRYRPCELEWIERVVQYCQENGIPVFVKQLGTHLAKKMGLKDRHGAEPSEWPVHLRVQEFPVI